MCLKAADMMDKAGNKAAALEIAMIKVHAPTWRCASSTTPSRPMAAPASARTSTSPTAMPASAPCALADGPDEVHARAIAKMEYARHAASQSCEERSDAAIHLPHQLGEVDCFASLAMTGT
jgi:hypothetical protein